MTNCPLCGSHVESGFPIQALDITEELVNSEDYEDDE